MRYLKVQQQQQVLGGSYSATVGERHAGSRRQSGFGLFSPQPRQPQWTAPNSQQQIDPALLGLDSERSSQAHNPQLQQQKQFYQAGHPGHPARNAVSSRSHTGGHTGFENPRSGMPPKPATPVDIVDASGQSQNLLRQKRSPNSAVFRDHWHGGKWTADRNKSKEKREESLSKSRNRDTNAAAFQKSDSSRPANVASSRRGSCGGSKLGAALRRNSMPGRDVITGHARVPAVPSRASQRRSGAAGGGAGQPGDLKKKPP